MENTFDARLVRLHYAYLNHSGWSDLRILPPDDRKRDIPVLNQRYGLHLPPRVVQLVDGAEMLVERIRPYAVPDDTPYQFYLGLRDSDVTPVWMDAEQRHRSIRQARSENIVAIQTLALDIEPDASWRPKGTASTDEQLAACFGFVSGIADWCVKQGWERPLLVMSGNGYHLYFAVPRIDVTDANRPNIAARVTGFEALIQTEFGKQAKHAGMKIDDVGDLPRILKVWGTRSVKGDEPSRYRMAHPVGDPTRREDPVLRRFLLENVELPALAAKVQTKKGGRKSGTIINRWPTDAIKDINPDELGEVPPIDLSYPAARRFFESLPEILKEIGYDHSLLLSSVARALVFLFCQETKIAPDLAVQALVRDREALRRVFKQWMKINADLCFDEDTGDYEGAEGDVHALFMNYYLGWIDRNPDKFDAFLRFNGFLGAWEGTAAREVSRPFNPVCVSWEERRAAMADWMERRLVLGDLGVFVNNAEPSVSKTSEALRLMKAYPDKRFAYLAYSHELLNDVIRRAVAEYGLSPNDIVKVEGLDKLCSYQGDGGAAKVIADAERGIRIGQRYCAPGGLCGQRDVCRWHTQRQHARHARILLAPSAYLSQERFLTAKSWGNDRRDAVFIDEDATSYLGVRQEFPIEALRAYRARLVFFEGSDRSPYVESLLALVDFLINFAESSQVVTRYVPTLPRQRATLPWDQNRGDRAGHLAIVNSEDDAIDFTPALELVASAASGVVAEHEARAAVFDSDEENDIQGWPFYKHQETVYTFIGTALLPAAPIFVLDGTANGEYYRRAFRDQPRLEFLLPDVPAADRTFIKPAGRIVQIVDSGNSRGKLKSEAHFDRLIASIQAFLARRRAENPVRRFLLITYADRGEIAYESRFREALADQGVVVAHFGGIRGLDRYKGWDTIIVGGFRLHPIAYVDEARKVLGYEPTDWEIEVVRQVIATAERSFELNVTEYRDPVLRSVFAQKTLGEQNQAIARSRVLHPAHGAGAMVVIFNNFPIPGLLVEPMKLYQFDEENGLGRPQRYERGRANPHANVALRSAIARILADRPEATQSEVVAALRAEAEALRMSGEEDRARALEVSAPRVGQLWNSDEIDAATAAIQLERAKVAIANDLATQGITSEREISWMLEEWAPTASESIGDFWVPSSKGLVRIRGTGITRNAQLEVEARIRAMERIWKERRRQTTSRGKTG